LIWFGLDDVKMVFIESDFVQEWRQRELPDRLSKEDVVRWY